MKQLNEILNKCKFISEITLINKTSVRVSTELGQFLIEMDFNRIESDEVQNVTVFNRGCYKEISWIPIWNDNKYFVGADFNSKSLSEAIMDVEEQLQSGWSGWLVKQIIHITYHHFEDFKPVKKGKGEIHYLFN